jgi:hypothetical protein
VLIAPGGELEFESGLRPALERALSGATFTALELGGDAPEPMIAKLLAYGLVKRA